MFDPERPTPDERSPPQEPPPGVFPAPWGVSGTLYGIAATFFLWFLLIGAVSPFLGEGGDPLAASPAVRYAIILLLQSVFVVVPVAALFLSRAHPAALGFRGTNARGILEAAGVGIVLFALTYGYDAAGARFMPDLAARALEEQEQQLQMLAGPVAVLWGVAVLLVPIMEETFFRGFVFSGLRGRLDFAVASGLSAAFFALFHGMPYSAPPLFAVGLGTAILFERHRSIIPCAFAHGSYNLISLISETLR